MTGARASADDAAAAVRRVSRLYTELADAYDSSGVEFFGPMARRLVELIAPRPGERALDIGCGRGAVSLPLAEAVGPGGAVTAADLVPAMVEALPHTKTTASCCIAAHTWSADASSACWT